MKKVLSLFLSFVLLLTVTTGMQFCVMADDDDVVTISSLDLSILNDFDPDDMHIGSAVPQNIGVIVEYLNDDDELTNGVDVMKSGIYNAEQVDSLGYDGARAITSGTFSNNDYYFIVELCAQDDYVFGNDPYVYIQYNSAMEFPCNNNPYTRVFGIRFTVDSYLSNGLIYKIETKDNQNYAVLHGYRNAEIPENLNIPSSIRVSGNSYYVKEIADRALGEAPVKKIVVPNTVTSIAYLAFYRCQKLESIEIPASVKSIAKAPCSNCKKLKAITVSDENEKYVSENGVLFNKDKTTLIQYPGGADKADYTVPASVNQLGFRAFSGVSTLKKLNTGKSLLSECVFTDSSMESISISKNNATIPKGAFDGSSIKSILLPSGVKKLEERSFSQCSALKKVVIPKTVTNIAGAAFINCNNLQNVTFEKGSKISSIGSRAFGISYSLPDDEGYFVKGFTISRYRTDNNVATAVQKMVTATRKYDSDFRKFTVPVKVLDPLSIKDATVTGIVDKTFNGKPQTQNITVKVNGKTLAEKTDYTVTYKNNTKIGTATMVIKGVNNYTGTVKRTFRILPRRPSFGKAKPGKSSLVLSWGKQSNITGYQIQYSTTKRFTKKTTVTKSYKKSAKKAAIKKLGKRTVYYARIRTYKKVGGKRYYSKWSKVVKTTTK